jgi:hypothetical protein
MVNSMTANQSTPRPRALQAVRRVGRALKPINDQHIPVSSDADRKRRSELEREVAHSTSALLGSWVSSAFSAPDQIKRRAQGW